MSIASVAEHLNVSSKTLSKVLNGLGAITPEMAVRLELAFAKPTADHWLRLQNAYDLSALRNQKTTLKVQSYELA